MDHRHVEAEAYRATVDDRIAELIRYRTWYRTHRWAMTWPSYREHMDELRALLRLARKARVLARPALERLDPMTLAGADNDWRGDHHIYPAGVGR